MCKISNCDIALTNQHLRFFSIIPNGIGPGHLDNSATGLGNNRRTKGEFIIPVIAQRVIIY